MTPHGEALAFRIWQYCQPREWMESYNEVAEALGVDPRTIAAVARHKGWGDRFAYCRETGADAAWRSGAPVRVISDALDGGSYRVALRGVVCG